MKVLIVAGGKKPSSQLIQHMNEEVDFVIGADRGAEYLLEAGIKPKYIVGDFDSSSKEAIDKIEESGAIKYKYKCEKDSTDSDIALDLAIEKEASIIYIMAVTGTRLDHSFANFGLLKKACKNGTKAIIIDDNNMMTLINDNATLKKNENYKYISFLAYSDVVKNFNIRNAKYPLESYDLKLGDNRTVSNEFLDGDIEVSFESGNILVIYSKD